MPSPFPGMDPYLEAPDIWPDLHKALARETSAVLNQALPQGCYARLNAYAEWGQADKAEPVPDFRVGPMGPLDEPLRHAYVEIRDPARGHHLVTLIEIVSPNCKRAGADREAYFRKQREVLDSDASLIEIDLLRAGQRPLADAQIEVGILGLRPVPDYLVQVNRAWTRSTPGKVQIFPVQLTESLPVFPVPLRQGQDEVPLDLQFVFNRAYDRGPYRRGAVEYTQPPRPPLPDDLAEWGRECVRAAGLVPG